MNKLFRSLVVLLVVSFSLSTFSISHAEAGVTEDYWVTKKRLRQTEGALGVAVVNGKIYAMVKGINYEYDPAKDTWTAKKPMPTARWSFGIAVCQNKIYVIGGYVGWDNATGLISSGVNEVYDPATDTWETKKPMPTNRSQLNANVVNGKIYLIGGRMGGLQALMVGLNEVYDVASDSWTTKKKIPYPVADYASAVVDGKVYVIGGQCDFTPEDLNDDFNQIYDPETDKWSQGAPPPSGGVRQGSVVVTTGKMAPKRIYVLDEVLRVCNPETDGWTFGANISTYRQNLGIALVNDMLYAIGGNTYTYEYLYSQIRGGSVTPYATNEQYTPFGYGIVPSVVSPETNKTYVGSDIPLTFTLGKPASWIGYSLDGQESVTITGNTTLSGLPDGSHSLTVYAKDVAGNTGASETIYFSIKTQQSNPFPTTWIVTAIAIIAIGAVAFLVYFRKIKKTTGEAEKQFVRE